MNFTKLIEQSASSACSLFDQRVGEEVSNLKNVEMQMRKLRGQGEDKTEVAEVEIRQHETEA